MKQLIFIVAIQFSLICSAQYTAIPDINFENRLIWLGIDSGSPDGQVLTANCTGITSLHVWNENISDLTGIEAFTSLEELFCFDNNLTSLNVSQNTNLNKLQCHNNSISSLNVSNNPLITSLYINGNGMTSLTGLQNLTGLLTFICVDNLLTTLDVSQNTSMTTFMCVNNSLTELDLSNNVALTAFNCMDNNLNCLNMKNGNNSSLTTFLATGNSNLTCIEVDDPTWSNSNWTNIDSWASFNIFCNNACSSSSSAGTNEESLTGAYIVKIVDLIGRETYDKPNTTLIYIYSDGTTQKVYRME